MRFNVGDALISLCALCTVRACTRTDTDRGPARSALCVPDLWCRRSPTVLFQFSYAGPDRSSAILGSCRDPVLSPGSTPPRWWSWRWRSGLFEPAESGEIVSLMRDFFARTQAEGHVSCSTSRTTMSRLRSPDTGRRATDGSWELLMIAVRRGRQGQGRGAALMREVEDDLRERDQRLLLVETSGVPEFARTRAFYDKCGYTAEARVRDYYAAGDDMVLYQKDLTAPRRATASAGGDEAGGPGQLGQRRCAAAASRRARGSGPAARARGGVLR